jgi:hypothetical protein
MKDQLITLETAKLAKEKGFDTPTPWYYHPRYGLHTAFWEEDGDDNSNHNSDEWADGYYSAPTQSTLQKWLREKHHLHVFSIREEDDWIFKYCEFSQGNKTREGRVQYATYEQALEAGLLEALRLI